MQEKYINKENIQNKYNLDLDIIHKIHFILEDYFLKIEKLEIKSMNLREQLSLLGVIAEVFPLFYNPEKYIEISHELLLNIRERIYGNEIVGISLYDGLCNLAVFLKILNENSGCYSNLYSKIQDLIIQKLESVLPNIINKNEIAFYDYDSICGLSGITNYLLSDVNKNARFLHEINDYFVGLGFEYIQNGEKHINWVSKLENSSNEDFLDFSIAHGIAGPLLVLSRLYNNNIIIPNQKKAISNICNEYEYISTKTGTNIWSGKVKKCTYFDNNIEVHKRREGWCYGTASVSMVLLEAALIINNALLYEKAYSRLCDVANMTVGDMLLTNEILCHGYSGMAALYRNLFDLYKEPLFKKKAFSLLNITLDAYSSESEFGFLSEDIAIYNGVEVRRSCDKMDFLEGSAGIIMELSSWIKNKSSYEKMLMIK